MENEVERVLRGGCWINGFSRFRLSRREHFVPGFPAGGIGFRAVRAPRLLLVKGRDCEKI